MRASTQASFFGYRPAILARNTKLKEDSQYLIKRFFIICKSKIQRKSVLSSLKNVGKPFPCSRICSLRHKRQNSGPLSLSDQNLFQIIFFILFLKVSCQIPIFQKIKKLFFILLNFGETCLGSREAIFIYFNYYFCYNQIRISCLPPLFCKVEMELLGLSPNGFWTP